MEALLVLTAVVVEEAMVEEQTVLRLAERPEELAVITQALPAGVQQIQLEQMVEEVEGVVPIRAAVKAAPALTSTRL